jgi:hypothetical protein
MLVRPAHRDIGTQFDRPELLARRLLGIPIGRPTAGFGISVSPFSLPPSSRLLLGECATQLIDK